MPAGLLRALEGASLGLLPDFGPGYLSELLWSMAVLEYQPGDEFLKV